ncbi:hypothetical protein [Ferruginibacter sp.]
MKKYWRSLLVLTTIFISATLQAQTPPSFMLVSKIEESASYLGQLNREPFEKGEAESQWASAASDRANTCIQAISNFSKSPNAAAQTFKVKFKEDAGFSEPVEKKLTLDEVTAYVTEYYALARLSKLRRDLEQDVMRCNVWFEDLSNGKQLDMVSAGVAKSSGEDMQKRLKTVQSLGLQSKVTVTIYNVEYDFDKQKQLADYTALAGGKQYDAVMAARNAKDKPFLDALSGGKKKVFMDELAGNDGMWDCSGTGGSALKTPAQLNSANTWYTWGVNTDGLITTWHITGYVFNGNELVKTTSKRGIGSRPSAADFK